MDIAASRLRNQQVATAQNGTARELVAWMGAMQAQDLPMAKWAVGLRLPGSSEAGIEAAMNQGEILRTHVLRPTWHLVSADDIYWMLELTAPQIRASMRARHSQLELTNSVVSKSNKILERALRDGKQLGREVLVAEFEKAGITDENNRAAHLLMWAELEGIICSGTTSAAKQSYALLAEKVPSVRRLSREEALATLARRYFTSHGPATLQDFTWWSGLYVGDAKEALELAKPALTSESIASQIYWFGEISSKPPAADESVHLLPAYDEFIISYRDRSASMPRENHQRAISSNGIFRPVTVVHGQVTGLWRRMKKGLKLELEVEPFDPLTDETKERILQAAAVYAGFLERQVVLRFKDPPG